MYLLPAGKDQRAKAQETVSKGESAFFFFLIKLEHFAYRQLHSKNSSKGICQAKGRTFKAGEK